MLTLGVCCIYYYLLLLTFFSALSVCKHKFIEKCKNEASAMLPKIEKAKQIRASMALQAHDTTSGTSLPGVGPQGDSTSHEAIVSTVPSKRHDDLHVLNGAIAVIGSNKQATPGGAEPDGEGDFGTVIVHDRVETGKTATLATLKSLKEPSPALRHTGNLPVSGAGDKANDSWMGNVPIVGSQASSPMFVFPEQNLKANSVPQGTVGSSVGITGTSLANETVSRKALDKATDISPIALLSDNVLGGWQQESVGIVAIEAMQEPFTGDTQPKKGRSRQNEVL